MSVTVSSLTTRYPEFAAAKPAQVQACIDDAMTQVNASAWGDRYDRAVSLLAAHFLALSPFGLGLQLGVRRDPERNDTTDNGSTVYEQQYLELRASNIVGLAVA